MNKKMREILAKIEEKQTLAKAFMAEGESKDVDKATALLDECDALRKEFDAEKRLFEAEKEDVQPEAEKQIEQKQTVSAEKAFANAARRGFKGMNEGDPVEGVSEGGYTVPEDIQTRINEYRDAKRSLRDLITIEKVNTLSGARTYKKRAQQTGFSLVGEGTAIGAKSTPQFTRLTYKVAKYGGYFAVTNELLADSDANIVNVLTQWIGDESRITSNKLVLAAVATKAITDLHDIDDIKRALNVTLGQAFKPTSVIVTNDDGLQYLDTLKDGDGKYLLARNPSDPMRLVLCAGATTIPVEVVPNADLASNSAEYRKTTDTKVITGKTYYTRSGSGTAESPYVYTAVENPATASIANYYEKFTGVPFIIGDLKEGVVLFDRQMLTLKQSDVAVVGSGDNQINAFEDDETIIRALEREDIKVRDASAFVNGLMLI